MAAGMRANATTGSDTRAFNGSYRAWQSVRPSVRDNDRGIFLAFLKHLRKIDYRL